VPESGRPPLEFGSETVLAVWFVGPFEAHGSAQASIRNDFGLAAGTAVNVYYAEEPLDSTWVLGGTLTAADGAEWLEGTAEIGAFTTIVATTGG
jgi:hypothetical protein